MTATVFDIPAMPARRHDRPLSDEVEPIAAMRAALESGVLPPRAMPLCRAGQWGVRLTADGTVAWLTAGQAVELATGLRRELPYPGAADDARIIDDAACQCVLNGRLSSPAPAAWSPSTGQAGLALLAASLCLWVVAWAFA